MHKIYSIAFLKPGSVKSGCLPAHAHTLKVPEQFPNRPFHVASFVMKSPSASTSELKHSYTYYKSQRGTYTHRQATSCAHPAHQRAHTRKATQTFVKNATNARHGTATATAAAGMEIVSCLRRTACVEWVAIITSTHPRHLAPALCLRVYGYELSKFCAQRNICTYNWSNMLRRAPF